ncbi:MAG TPA: DUF3048 domain-containing protein [Bacillota bacterium]|nr:DUF3048 domain-containing protein [Bacillota bacterium]
MRQRRLYFVVLVLILLAACTNDKTDEQSNNDAEEQQLQPKKSKEPEIYPLTGIGTDRAADNRIVGVMVNNHQEARPQSGLSKADIVFEILAEGSITRFLALFQSEQPDVVGPVRSAREYYANLADGYGALYVYHGAADFIDDMIATWGIEHLNGSVYDNDGRLFKRVDFRAAPHNSYLQFAEVYDVAEQNGYSIEMNYEPLPFLTDAERVDIPGDDAGHVEVIYSESPANMVEFAYDEHDGVYTRYSNREKTVERQTNEPVQVDNILIVETPHQTIDDAGRREIDLESGGDGFLIQRGKARHVQWQNKDGRIIPMENGEPVGFVPGKTWVNVVPTEPGMKQSVTISD